MKKRFNSIDINQKHGSELSKKLYKTITDQSKRLDDARSCTRNIVDLFSPISLIQRRKFGEYCERLIFSDPGLFGRKGEELLWRKVFYDVVSSAKKMKKGNYSDEEVSNLLNHIYSGIGFYHHMILKLQTSFNINLPNVIDFSAHRSEKERCGELNSDPNFEWAEQSLHQCLMYLGDLSRYKLEISANSDAATPTRYYMQAITYKPDYGMPYNQMGTLAMNQDCHLEAVYHYMRCLSCKYFFDGTTNNLNSLFEKNSKYIEQLPQEKEDLKSITLPSKSEHVKRFKARFLLLIDIWYFNKNVPKVYNLCHLTFKDLDECLSYTKSISENGDIDTFESDFINSPSYLSYDTLFHICVICLLSIAKLQSNNSPQVSTVAAFTLAVYSQLIQNVTAHIQDSVLNYPLAEVNISSLKKSKCRNKITLRRRKLNKDVSEDSESSEDDLSVSSSDQSFISDQEDSLANSSEDEVEGGEIVNGDSISTKSNVLSQIWEDPNKNSEARENVKEKEEVFEKLKKMDVNDMIEIISEENLLQSIKILNDWLMIDTVVFKSCCLNTQSLLRQITYFLNLVNIDVNNRKLNLVNLNFSNLDDVNVKIPLPEDIILKGLDFLSESHRSLNWGAISNKTLSLRDETVIRIFRFKSFARYLSSIPEAGISFDEKENLYICTSVDNEQVKKDAVGDLIFQDFPATPDGQLINGKVKDEASAIPNNSKGGHLVKMKHMGQLWLASEVSALENRVKGRSSLSPYLVLDADALIKYTFMVKHLVHTRKFIVLVPNAVVSVLDDLKREKPEARDAIRWLEAQFHRGNRFFRSQRPQERALIPFIKYPKRKDKEMFTYIQIIECCYYLSEQQKGATNLVTLLIGNQNLLTNGENKEFSYVGLAQTAGITIESITQFYAKSKKTIKDNSTTGISTLRFNSKTEIMNDIFEEINPCLYQLVSVLNFEKVN